MNRTLFAVAGAGLAISALALPAHAYETKTFDLGGAYIHDVSPAPGGLVYWTAQQDGKLGILDPRDGSNRFVELGEGSAPHGVITAKDGSAWITDGGQNAIVHYEPASGKVTVYPLPADTGYTNLNTPTIDGDGDIWFTGQNGIYGRVDLPGGTVRVWNAPKGRGPYGITTTPDGNVWYSSLAGSYLGQIDRRTGEAKVIEPPEPGVGLRRVWSDSKGDLWMSEWNGGQLARYSPATGAWKRWAVPGTGRSRLYGVYVDDKDIVWFSNYGMNAVYSFDPATETFTEVPGSRPRSEVKQILGLPGMLWLPESGNSSIMAVDTTAE